MYIELDETEKKPEPPKPKPDKQEQGQWEERKGRAVSLTDFMLPPIYPNRK